LANVISPDDNDVGSLLLLCGNRYGGDRRDGRAFVILMMTSLL
jgi:hypothetical protein